MTQISPTLNPFSCNLDAAHNQLCLSAPAGKRKSAPTLRGRARSYAFTSEWALLWMVSLHVHNYQNKSLSICYIYQSFLQKIYIFLLFIPICFTTYLNFTVHLTNSEVTVCKVWKKVMTEWCIFIFLSTVYICYLKCHFCHLYNTRTNGLDCIWISATSCNTLGACLEHSASRCQK